MLQASEYLPAVPDVSNICPMQSDAVCPIQSGLGPGQMEYDAVPCFNLLYQLINLKFIA